MNNTYNRLLDLVINEAKIKPIKPSEYKDKQARERDRGWSPIFSAWEAARKEAKEAARKSKE
tara:strand:+ start:397 stop:582 length:186 start_codon:yes stop_codon:yes gene_type:complete